MWSFGACTPEHSLFFLNGSMLVLMLLLHVTSYRTKRVSLGETSDYITMASIDFTTQIPDIASMSATQTGGGSTEPKGVAV
jgi:hypothetical protein